MTTPQALARYFTHRRPSAEVVQAAQRAVPGAGPGAVAARIRQARKTMVNPVEDHLDATGLDAAIAACYASHRPWDGDELTENSGGETWARRQSDGTEVARLDSSFATYVITRRDLPGGARGYHITIWWWD